MLKVKHIVVVILLSLSGINAQDVHFSQFDHHHQSVNPALSGYFDGDHRLTMNYRNQWLSVPVPYMTVGLYFDSRLTLKGRPGRIGWGIGMDYDQVGDSHLSMAKLAGSINYGHVFANKHMVSLGITPGVAQRRLNNSKLRWDEQWTGDRYDPSLSSKENYDATGKFFLDLGAGLSYHFMQTSRTYLTLGGSIFHLNKPDQTFYGQGASAVELPYRYVGQGTISIGMGDFMDLILLAQYQQQLDYSESVGNALLNFYLNRKPGSKLNMIAGFGVRLDDAMIPRLGFEWNNWMISGSYDLNTSSFKTATNKRGGPELALRYIYRSVKPIGIYKKCPIY
ncbi:MAG: PorP/SprF family type IX secretion system membrane protein [Bacteroidota bacterium]|nr:PorP/SprF family type IX secretion system membrane protein [Bacteroidota bacterium]